MDTLDFMLLVTLLITLLVKGMKLKLYGLYISNFKSLLLLVCIVFAIFSPILEK